MKAPRQVGVSPYVEMGPQAPKLEAMSERLLKLVEMKLINLKGCSNSIYVVFNISNLLQAKHLSPHCVAGWREGANDRT